MDALGLASGVGFLVARFIPVARLIPFWGCAFRRATGWPCPGCGLTRVADKFAHGDFLGAWNANPLGTLGAALCALAVAATALHLALGMPLPSAKVTEKERRWLLAAVVTAAVVNYAFVIVKTRFPAWL